MGLWAAVHNEGTEILTMGQYLHHDSRPKWERTPFPVWREESFNHPLLEDLIKTIQNSASGNQVLCKILHPTS